MTLIRVRQLAALAVITLLLAACSSQPPSSGSDGKAGHDAGVPETIAGKRWNLLLIGTDERVSMPSTPYFSVAADGSVSGSDGCNNLTGTASFGDNQRIEFSELASTRKACPQMADAARVQNIFDQAYRYLIDHDRIVFFGPNSLVLGGFRLAH